jgi:L-rhamnose 1-dehydrogenase
VSGDLTLPKTPTSIVSEAAKKLGRLDVLINNAGICTFSDFHEVTDALLEKHMAVNFTAAYRATQAATKQMIGQGTGGSVVSIASITAVRGSSALTHYAPTKAAILGMNVACASALGTHGIRFNSICPGTIETTMNKGHLDLNGKREVMAAKAPLGRLGTPEDVAGAAVFFASDLSAYVTGQYLLVDGGASIHYE